MCIRLYCGKGWVRCVKGYTGGSRRDVYKDILGK